MKCYITTLPGIEAIAKEEIESKWSDVRVGRILKARNNSLLFFEFHGDHSELLRIGTAEDVYADLCSVELLGKRADLAQIQQTVQQAKTVEPALAAHRKLHPIKTAKRTTFRVIAQATGDRSACRRIDAQKAVERAISERYHKRWRLVEDDARIEFWLHLVNTHAVAGLRLSDKTMRHRTYKIEHLPASLRPTIAYALVWLSGINANDVFLDPMCGAGTILIERANAGRYGKLLGGDMREEAVLKTLKNIGNKYKPISVKVWDARKIPLADGSVNKVASNLPFGRQIGSHRENATLYSDFSQELSRVLKPGGRAVLLTSERNLMERILQRNKRLRLVHVHKNIRFWAATPIFLWQSALKRPGRTKDAGSHLITAEYKHGTAPLFPYRLRVNSFKDQPGLDAGSTAVIMPDIH